MACHEDYTLMRPLVMDFTSDLEARNVDDQFLLGPSLMVAPVYTYGARSRNVYFPPARRWYDFYTGNQIPSPSLAAPSPSAVSVLGGYPTESCLLDISAPYERIPLFIPEGSILPTGPDIQYSSEQPDAPLTIYVYTGHDAHFTLYYDDGTTYAYERGEFATIPLTWDEAAATLTIGERQGSYANMPASRTFHIVFVTPAHPVPFGSEEGTVCVEYKGSST